MAYHMEYAAMVWIAEILHTNNAPQYSVSAVNMTILPSMNTTKNLQL